jgi:hypothetical protein
LILFPATVGGLFLYFGYGWRRALWAAAATFVFLFALGAIDTALGPGLSGGGGMPAPAGAR